VAERLRQLDLMDCLGATSGSTLHRGRLDGKPVLVKRSGEGKDPLAAATGLSLECELLEMLAAAGVGPRPLELLPDPIAPSMVLENRPGALLDGILARRLPGTEEALAIATDLARALSELHAAQVVHRDLRPANVLVGWTSEASVPRACLVDLSRAAPEGAPGDIDPCDDLAYLSPERTGHLGRDVDPRSDLYSLGVLLYRLLTGELPFQATDLIGWVHCHVARRPRPPAELGPVPAALSDVVMKLLAKLPDDRYQSARGVVLDLQECLRQHHSGVAPFTIGARDVPARFQLPARLYGREAELEVLARAFRRTVESGAPGVVLVAGPAGMGKSALVDELRHQLLGTRAWFASARFDHGQHGSPHATLARALSRLVAVILSASEREVSRWRSVLQEALGDQGRLLVDVVPQLGLLVGPQRPVPDLPPREAQRRFERLWQRFVGALASAEHPVVLFLDDIQWIDAATLLLLERVVGHPDTRHLLVLGACREDEVGSSHPLARTIDGLRGRGVSVEEVSLRPFRLDDANALVADTLRCDRTRCQPLATLIHAKTEGNPFFFVHFLSMLHDEGLLTLDRSRGEWSWDLGRIEAKENADNVAALMAAELEHLPEPVRRVLRIAACLGNRIDLDMVALVDGRPRGEVEADLSGAVERGFVRVTPGGAIRFAHDWVQEAAYELLPDEERPAVHLAIGRLLVERAGPGGLGERIFDVVSHLHQGERLLGADERVALAGLELEAGRKAQAATAYLPAARHFAAGQGLLPDGSWDDHHALSWSLALERARCEWLTGEGAVAEKWIYALLGEARTRVESAEAYRVGVDLLTAIGDVVGCVRTVLHAGSELYGLDFPLHPTRAQLGEAVAGVLEELGGREIEGQLDAPAMTDPDLLALQALYSSAAPNLFFVDPVLHDLVVCALVRLSLRHGPGPHASHLYVSFAMMIGCGLGRWSEAFRFSRVACALADRYPCGSKVGTYFVAGGLQQMTSPPGEAAALLRTAWRAAVEGGDTNHGCYAGLGVVTLTLASGAPLADVAEEIERQLDFARSVGYGPVHDSIVTVARLVESLRGGTARLGSFEGPGFDPAALEARLPTYPLLPEGYHGFRALAELVGGDFAASLAAASRARPFVQPPPFTINEGYWLYTALAAAGRHAQVDAEERAPLLAVAREARERIQARAQQNPRTFGAQLGLVDAELARLEGRDLAALRGYDEAIAAARAGGFTHVEALAGEAAARLHLQIGSVAGAATHLRAARDAYRRWGAPAKVEALEAAHPGLRSEAAPSAAPAGTPQARQLDLVAAARASQAISGELNLERLLETLLRTVVESAGAQHGWLALEGGGTVSLAARATVSGSEIEVHVLAGSPGDPEDLPATVLSYVRRTGEPVVLPDADAPNPFSPDAGLRWRHARSVVCLPILRQGAVTGLLYLENDLVPSAFTPERLALLELLAAQAAISLELSRHRERLEQEVRSRTEELTRANQSLVGANQRLERAHRQLVHSEKMASIGQLAAGVAHEINNPVAYVVSNVHALEGHFTDLMQVLEAYQANARHLPPAPRAEVAAATAGLELVELREELTSLVADTRHGLDRVRSIVQALRTLSRVSETSWQVADVRSGLESTLHVLRNELERKAAVVLEHGELPCVECLPSELNQVFMNLLLNAAQAIPERGVITVRTGSLGGEVWIEVSDTGVGIAPENLPRIFDPFFTTKPVGEGTGLGLSLAYGIVEKHHGTIEVASERGRGARFRVRLPVCQPAGDRDAGPRPVAP
jgi:predicted ATPase/signal transduction histidine kinase